MPATDRRTRFGLPAGLREAAAGGLRVVEASVSAVQQGAERWLPRAKLALRAWREALDPTTATWIDQARNSSPTRSPEESRTDLRSRIEAARNRR